MRVRLAAFLLITVFAAACDLGTVNIPKTASSVVVHAVLNPSSGTQVVLLERTLTGTVTLKDKPFDSTDPIASDGGIPISGATVDILDSTGRVFRGVEDIVSIGPKGAGVYRIPLGGQSMVGARYQLRIRTQQGEDVTAATRLPRPAVRFVGGLTRNLNRDHDTMLVAWNAVAGARAYAARVESPFGPFFVFTDSTRVGFTGDLRNLFASDLPRLFIPGFRQDMVVAAVDSNFYDYYRTNNDPFTGSGIISRIKGGVGMFGAFVSLNTGTITVSADQTEPGEGRFRLVATSDPGTSNFLSQVVLYVESRAVNDGLPTSLSGRYTTNPPNSRSDGVVGQLLGASITLALLTNQLVGDTVEVFDGELHGDTLTGNYRSTGGFATFVRTP